MQVALDVLSKSFPAKMAGWKPKLSEIIPSYGEKLNSDADKARQNMAYTAKILELSSLPSKSGAPKLRSAGDRSCVPKILNR